ncbi:hypothetical protein PBCV1_a167L [Paramecium bursaria Chlorella virus 1]|uniref:Uncharacterized protein n=1 Tax=Paramecium bursaria Chlorella virus 1 TaxID=10506 RepID=Q84487_PBCV1|nr:hypothetical protein PBCV1_a167L [Paramecium bursaria Chlorella virus 1]AAC96535.1 hypothetical protein [Paramecium bursaria Chlorella virus 1]
MRNFPWDNFSSQRAFDLYGMPVGRYSVRRCRKPWVLIVNEKTEFEHSTPDYFHGIFGSFCFVFNTML